MGYLTTCQIFQASGSGMCSNNLVFLWNQAIDLHFAICAKKGKEGQLKETTTNLFEEDSVVLCFIHFYIPESLRAVHLLNRCKIRVLPNTWWDRFLFLFSMACKIS